MVRVPPSAAKDCDVIVVGAGLAGAAAALGFARAGFSVVSCGETERLGQGRTVALLGKSGDFFRELSVWDRIEADAAPLRALRIIDATGSLFAARPVEFNASEIGLEEFGWNIENARLADILAESLAEEPNVVRVQSRIDRFDFSPRRADLTTADGRTFSAKLVVGADGRASPTRKAAAIGVRTHRYGQGALTVLLAHRRPHNDFSTEFHTRQGPFTLVPLPQLDGAGFRSGLVWVMSEAESQRRSSLDEAGLAQEIEDQTCGLLGQIRIEGACGVFPMIRQSVTRLVGTRVALVGDAAHAFPPIGAQGLNLGLRDVQALLRVAQTARREGSDFGAEASLSQFAASRGADIAVRTAAVNALNMSLLADLAPVDALRGLGLTALNTIGPLRRAVMREGVAPFLGR
jgi:2-octaprenyl-6-methoxyphenol hydroxylase